MIMFIYLELPQSFNLYQKNRPFFLYLRDCEPVQIIAKVSTV